MRRGAKTSTERTALVQTTCSTIRRTHVVITFLAFAALLTPTLFCAVPATSMSASEAECCLRMSRECGSASMSACCETVAPSLAITAALTKKVPAPSWETLHYAVAAITEFVPAVPSIHDQIAPPGSSPPRIDSASSIQVLRI